MTIPPFNVDEYYPQWNAALEQINELMLEMGKAEEAGIKTGTQRQALQKIKEHFERLKRVYTPDRP